MAERTAAGIREATTAQLTDQDLGALRRLFAAAWPDGGFSNEDWTHAMGGRHWLVEEDGRIVSHASVVERVLEVGGRPLRTGYVEAVATAPSARRRGLASRAMRAVGAHIRTHFELGALSTGHPEFYERLGWARWRGPTFVRTDEGLVRAQEEDGGILVLVTPATPAGLDPAAPISCRARVGDAW